MSDVLMGSNVLMGFVGDVFVDRANPHEVFGQVREVLNAPRVLFGNLEGAYTDEPRPVPPAYTVLGGGAHNLDVYSDVGFNVMSMANNHILDVGYEAMLENQARLNRQGVRTCGAGTSIAAARAPAIVDADGLRVAFLAYASVFPVGYEARSDRAGLAPLRAYNFWREPVPAVYGPGRRPLLTTVPDEHDLAALADDIRRAKETADLVITSFHWGDYTRPFHLSDHEVRTARFCVDQGADMVVGHHHHALRGMEWYKGKPIMYGLGHFVFDLRLGTTEEEFEAMLAEVSPEGYYDQMEYRLAPRKGWPLLPMHEDTRMTVLAWATAGSEGVRDIGFLPCLLTPDGAVRPLPLDSPEGKQVIDYLQRCNRAPRLAGTIVPDGAVSLAGHPTMRVIPAAIGAAAS